MLLLMLLLLLVSQLAACVQSEHQELQQICVSTVALRRRVRGDDGAARGSRG